MDVQRIPLQRKEVPHSYTRHRLLQNTPPFRSPNTNENQHVGIPTISARELASGSSTNDPNRLAMTGYAGAVYYADVGIGASSYKLIVDTGSTDTWVSCYVYDASRCVETCPRAALSITYGSGTVCVSTEILTVKLGGLIVRDYGVGVALSPTSRPGIDGLLLGRSQGILGLGYPALATIQSVPGYFVKFLSKFSVFFAPRDSASGSFLLLNAVDDNYVSQHKLVPYSIPLKKATHWTIGLTGFSIAGYKDVITPCAPRTNGSCDAIIDTGTTLIVVPQQVFRVFVTEFLLPAGCYESQSPESRGMYICARSVQLPRLRFSFGEKNFYLDMEDYIQRTGSVFYVEIQASGGSLQSLQQSWVVGGTFLKKFYSSYEVSRAVVFYCDEGKSCDQNAAAGSVQGEAVLASEANGSANSEPMTTGSASTLAPPGISGIGSNATSGGILPPTESPSSTGTVVSTTASSGNSQTTTIAVIASLAGLAFVLAIVFVVYKLYRKRQNRQPRNTTHSLAGMEVDIETVASSGGVESAYAAGTALTPLPVGTKQYR